MRSSEKKQIFWGLGLQAGQAGQIGGLLGDGQKLVCYEAGKPPSVTTLERERPSLAFISSDWRQSLPGKGGEKHLELLPKILLLDEKYTQADLEAALDAGVTDVLRPPFTVKSLKDKLRKAVEVETIHNDVLCMTREILLEREILERKNGLLEFLVNFLTGTAESLNVLDLLQASYQGLQRLFPVRGMHAALWRTRMNGERVAETYVAAPAEADEAKQAWATLLHDVIRQENPDCPVELAVIHQLELKGQAEEWRAALPEDGYVLRLPLRLNGELVGALAVLTNLKHNIGRDQALSLHSAMHHLALSLKNAQSYQLATECARCDPLTGIHNRRFFEEALQEEVRRSLRYKIPLSMVLLDLDHFKHVNDSHGHPAGDQVLRETACLLQENLRSSDLCARYGGEEFVLLLPHTDDQAALRLAERIRANMDNHVFRTADGGLHVSASLGLSTLCVDCQPDEAARAAEDLVLEADRALYDAKEAGRNRVRMAGPAAANGRGAVMAI